MFIFSHFHTSLMSARKLFTPQHSNKNIHVEVDQSQDCVVIHTHTDAYVSAYTRRVRSSNMKEKNAKQRK